MGESIMMALGVVMVFSTGFGLGLPSAYGDHQNEASPIPDPGSRCEGPFKGKKISNEELRKVLDDHGRWLHDHQDSKGEQANLCGAELSGADFREQDLSGANFQGANLSRADFTAAVN